MSNTTKTAQYTVYQSGLLIGTLHLTVAQVKTMTAQAEYVLKSGK